jgi:hypothetical protein
MSDGTATILNRMFRGSESRGRELRSMFFKRGATCEDITAGSTFRRTEAHVIETAEVLSISNDTFGIPHVRFNVSFQRPTRSVTHEGQRVLALKSFAARYTERCAAT